MAEWGEGKTAAMLIADNFEDPEAIEPKRFLEEHGVKVVPVGLEKKPYRGKRGATLAAEKTFDEVRAEDFDLVVLPGGGAPERLRIHGEPIRFIKDFWKLSRPLAAICHGPQLLISADLLRGIRMTAWPGIRDDVKLAGADYVDEPVVVTGTLITSRYPADIPQFNRAVAEVMEGRRRAAA